MEEQWRPVKCLPHQEELGPYTAYEVSNFGRIRSAYTKRIRKLKINHYGYYVLTYCFYYKDTKKKSYTDMAVHRIVALTWIDNPNNLPQIDHINRDKSDNRVENLRWCDQSENSLNRDLSDKGGYHSKYRPVDVYDKQNNYVETYPTLIDACNAYNITLKKGFALLSHDRSPYSWGYFVQKPIYKRILTQAEKNNNGDSN